MSKSVANSQQSLENVISLVRQAYELNKYIEVDIVVKGKARTGQQNAALHKWLSQVSVTLNEAGWDMKKTLSHHVEIPWDKSGINAKEKLFKPVYESLTGKDSTANADRVEYAQVYDVLVRHFGERGVQLPSWPSKE